MTNKSPNKEYELVGDDNEAQPLEPLELNNKTRSGHVHLGRFRTSYLSSSDMVLPLICSICIQCTYVALLLPIVSLYYDGDNSQDSGDIIFCTNIHWEIFILSSLIIHIVILISNILSMIIAFRAKALTASKWLNRLLSLRLLFNVLEFTTIIYGLYCLLFDRVNRECLIKNFDGRVIYLMSLFYLMFNISVVLITWFCLYCCLNYQSSSHTPINQSTDNNHSNTLRKYCSFFFYDEQSSNLSSSFSAMGGLIQILTQDIYDNLHLTPSDIVTGLHLLRMLQYHYGLFLSINNINDKKKKKKKEKLNINYKQLLKDAEYYTLYANAAYGIALYTLSKPCSICCACPCSLPDDLIDDDQDIVVRNDKECCPGFQIDNSSLKIYIKRTGIQSNDLLLVAQGGDLHKVNYYVSIDRKKKKLVIAIRGTMSIGDSVTDAECQPIIFPQINDKCMVHSGIGKCAINVFDKIVENQRIISFLKDDKYKDYGIVLTGHSLGAGVTVILSLMMKYGTHDNLKYFLNDNRLFNAYAIAPPSCIEKEFCIEFNDEVSSFLTCIIYGYDVIPRLSFASLLQVRSGINLLLNDLEESPWWVYQKSITMKQNTIIAALKDDTKYCNTLIEKEEKEEKYDQQTDDNDDNDEEKEQLLVNVKQDLPGAPGQQRFVQNVMDSVKFMKETYTNKLIQNGFDKDSAEYKQNECLWNKSFSQIGNVFHIIKIDVNINDDIDDSNEYFECITNVCHAIWNSMILNVCKCRCCLNDEKTEYYVYRANINSFCDKILISEDMISDHMPHLYLDVIQKLNAVDNN